MNEVVTLQQQNVPSSHAVGGDALAETALLPLRMRALILVGAAAASWGLVGLVSYGIYSLMP